MLPAMLSGCYLDVIGVLSEGYLDVIWVLSGCYLDVIWMLSGCYLNLSSHFVLPAVTQPLSTFSGRGTAVIL